MPKPLITLALLTCILFSSCQKELSLENNGNPSNPRNGGGNTGGSTNGELLVKVVAASSSGTTTTDYTYNPSKKLSHIKITGTTQGFDLGSDEKIYRDPTGIITRFAQTSAQITQAGGDSLVTNVYYDHLQSRYTYTISQFTVYGFTTLDSTAFIYDASGKLSAQEIYVGNSSIGPDYIASARFEFVYSSTGNMTTMKLLSMDATTNSFQLAGTYDYTYDNKVIALDLGDDAIPLNLLTQYSKNNMTGMNLTSLLNPASNFSLSTTYTYNSSSRPSSAVLTQNPGGVTNAAYYYQ